MTDYRVAVEAVIQHEGKILLVKRGANQEVAPDVWNVPACKIGFDETTRDAVKRCCIEQTNLPVRVERELKQRAFRVVAPQGEAPRLIFTYLVTPKVALNKFNLSPKHSASVWVTPQDIEDSKYDSLMPELSHIIAKLNEEN